MRRDDEPHDHRTRGNSVDAHYNFLREAGYGPDKARDWAERATDALHASQGDGGRSSGIRFTEGGASAPPASSPATECRARFRTPYFGPFAGRKCRVKPDGSLEPVDG